MKREPISSQAIDEIIQYLLSLPGSRLCRGDTELTMRCPFCGDSTKSSTSTNFYINVDKDSNSFFLYNCFRASCGVSGIVDQYFLEMVGFLQYDTTREFNSYMDNRRKEMKFSKSTKAYRGKRLRQLSNVINTEDKLSDKKLAYINKRLGVNFTYEDLIKYKINLNLNELLQFNRIEATNYNQAYYQRLSDYGVSFISAYNDYVIIRDVSKKKVLGKKYTNISIFNGDDELKIYSIPGKLDLLDPDPVVINVAEGAFDIIGVYNHLNIDRDYKNQLFIAACGSGIKNTIIHYISEYGLINARINIFADADVPKDKFKSIRKSLKKYMDDFSIRVFYNTKSKDFGVPKEDIELISSRL